MFKAAGKNIFTLLQSAQQFLKSKGLPEYKSDAEFLLSAALGIKRSKLALIRQEAPEAGKTALFESYVNRRAKREPAAYITGFCGFMDFEFKVNNDVLIPRPETELLVEEVLKTAEKENKKSVLDMCTGSGCIAISFAKLGKFEDVKALDISGKALALAKENAALNGARNIEFIESDMFENIKGLKFDIIVSNPPYVAENEYENLEPELMYEPKIAITADDKGLFFYKEIASRAREFLNDNGFIFTELNSNKAQEAAEIFKSNAYREIEIFKDYAGLPRLLKTRVSF